MAHTLTILYFVAWTIVLLRWYQKNKQVGAYSIIVLSYVLYALMSIQCYNLFSYDYPNITLFPFIYLFIMLVLALSPIKNYDRTRIDSLIGIKKEILYIVFSLFIISTLIVIPSALSHLVEGFTVLLANDDGAKDLYEEMHQNQILHANISGGLVGYCKLLRYLLFEVSVFLFFYYLTLPNHNRKLIAVLGLSFSLDILISLADGSRTNSTMSAFTLLMTGLIFYRFYDSGIKRYIRLTGLTIAGVFLFFTIAVTVGRSLSRESGAGEGMVEYLGQGNLNFNSYALDQGGIRYGDRTCNYFKRILGFSNVPESIRGVRDKYPQLKLNDHNFSTFIGDFAIDFGPYVTILIVIVFSFLFNRYTRPRDYCIRLDQLFIIQMVANICMHGGMYLFYYSFSGNFILIMYVVFTIVFRNNMIGDGARSI